MADVLARLMRDGGMLYFLLAIYFAVNAALRLVLQGSLEMEESRLVFLAQWLAPGYGDQAPLAVWIQHGVTRLVGANALSVIVFENLLLYLSYAFVGWAASHAIRNRALAIIAVLGMLFLPQVAYELQRDGGASVAALMAATFFIGALLAMLHRGSFFGYLLTGAGIGVGLLATYDFILLLAAALVAILLEPAFRARLANWRIIVTIVVAGAVLAPHAFWLRDNFDLVVAQNLARVPHHAAADQTSQRIEGLFSLAAALVGFVVPIVVVFWLAFGRRFPESWQASSPWTRLLGRIFLLVLLALIALVVIGGASAIRDRWLVPFLFMLPFYFSLKLDALNQTIGNAPKRFGAIAVLILIAIPAVLAVRVPAAHWTGRYTKVNLPYRPAIETILAAGSNPPSLILAEDAELAGNIRLGAKTIPVIAPGQTSLEEGYRFDESHPMLLVWRTGSDEQAPIPEPLAHLLASQVEAGAVKPVPEVIALPYLHGRAGDAYRLGYAWIYPPAL
jgi:4-amino-4-deoxy-L-arabinose transferase-like glycosyltransferase